MNIQLLAVVPLAIARENLGWTQESFAKKIGLSKATLSKIERNKYTPSIESIEKIYEALKLPHPSLFLRI